MTTANIAIGPDPRSAVAMPGVPEAHPVAEAGTGPDPDQLASELEGEERLMDHSYDGIQEYDNPLPSWWSMVFGATIAFALLYFAYYDIAGWGRSPAENYRAALAGWQAIYKASPTEGGPSVTEEMLAANADNPDIVARGHEVFGARCIGCHGASANGQIGPNLTDLYQLHGTTRMDLYGTIVGGAPGTAMIAWSETLKPTEIIAVASFVASLRGKNVPGKEPQGKPVPALAH